VERGGKTLLDFLATDDETGREAAAASLAGTVRASGGRLRVEKIDGAFSVGTALGDALVRAGFAPTPQGLRLRAGLGAAG
jgi:ATP-dependent Lhr-like helicase